MATPTAVTATNVPTPIAAVAQIGVLAVISNAPFTEINVPPCLQTCLLTQYSI